MTERTFLYEYRFEGVVRGFHIWAADRDEAEARLKAMGWSTCVGELEASVAAPRAPALRRACEAVFDVVASVCDRLNAMR